MQHFHHLVVLLLTLSITFKTILLLSGADDKLENFRKKTLVLEMIIATIVLATGFYQFFTIEGVSKNGVYHTKILLVLLSIPLGIVGFKKKKKALAVLSSLLLLGVYGYMIYVHYIA